MISTMRQHHRVRVGLSAFIAGASCRSLHSMLASDGNGAQVCYLKTKGTIQPQIIMATPMLDAIFQNTPGQSEGYALGVPKDYAWCSGSYKPAAMARRLPISQRLRKGANLSERGRARVFDNSRHNNCKCKNLHPPQHYPRMGVSPRPGHGRDRRGVTLSRTSRRKRASR